MEPINPLSRIIDLLRRQAVEATAKTGQKNRAAAASTPDAPSDRRQTTIEQLERQIGDKIRGLDRDAPNLRQRAARIFIESVLAWEFGDRIMNDPRFFALVDHVQSAMESDASIGATIKAMIDDMHARA
jgi:hypothetical protein